MTTNTKKKKTAREKRVIVASLIVAAVMIGGSTFAWFTSKDEVTNRLSANAKYDVSIVEDFQPPEDWIPGQTINKDVSAVNTGNVDAFVRMWLGGQMRLLNEDTPSVDASTGTPTSSLTAVTDADKTALGLNYYKDGKYYRTLSTDKIANPNDLAHAGVGNETANPVSGENSAAGFSEVQSVQAGGVLVYAPANAAYTWKLEQATEMKTFADDTDATGTVTNIAKDTVVGTYNSTTATSKISAKNTNYYGAIDASTFTPETTGLYLFRRNVNETADGTENKYEYSGYYYDSSLNKYFALHTDTGANKNSDYVLPEGTINDNSTATPSKDQVLPVTVEANKVFLYTATEKVIDTGAENTNLIWKYNAPDATKTTDLEKNGYFTVTYNNGTPDNTADDIVINVALANIKGATGVDNSESWTAIFGDPANHTTTFYYNNDVEAGDTTRKLVDSVELSKDTKNGAYLAFDFDLNVFLESVQVTMDEDGIEQITPAKEQFATAPTNGTAITANKVEATVDGAEITKIDWNKTT